MPLAHGPFLCSRTELGFPPRGRERYYSASLASVQSNAFQVSPKLCSCPVPQDRALVQVCRELAPSQVCRSFLYVSLNKSKGRRVSAQLWAFSQQSLYLCCCLSWEQVTSSAWASCWQEVVVRPQDRGICCVLQVPPAGAAEPEGRSIRVSPKRIPLAFSNHVERTWNGSIHVGMDKVQYNLKYQVAYPWLILSQSCSVCIRSSSQDHTWAV